MGAFSSFVTGKRVSRAKMPATSPSDPPPVATNAIYSYAEGPDNLGVGVMNLALERSRIPLQMNFDGPRYDIRGTIAPLEGASQFPLAPSGPAIDLRANGSYLMGPGVQFTALTNPNTGRATNTSQG